MEWDIIKQHINGQRFQYETSCIHWLYEQWNRWRRRQRRYISHEDISL